MKEQAGNEAQEFVWDPSLEAGLIEAVNRGAGEPSAVSEPDHDHDGVDPAALAELESSVIEVAIALHERYGDEGPTPEQEKEFMAEWLTGKGRSKEEIDFILAE